MLGGYEGCVIRRKFVDVIVGGGCASLALSPETPWQKIILQGLGEIYRLSQERSDMFELEVQRQLLGIWGELFRHWEDQGQTASDPEKIQRLRVILSYLHQHYGEKVTLEEVAKEVGLCKSECCRFFRRQMRQSLFDYLLDYRIGRSLPLLREGQATVAQVASQVGFSNPAYFSKVFRSRMKRSPRDYRAQGREVPQK